MDRYTTLSRELKEAYELQELHTWQNDSKIERFSRRESRVISFLPQGGRNPECSILKAITFKKWHVEILNSYIFGYFNNFLKVLIILQM